ncbi:MAG TPA: hemolysin family protein [Chloroflexota bacterium]|nr:hemolysin family protein [Chloroflexota bacterium]
MEFSTPAAIMLVLLLVFANGFFVAAEFALVTVRATRIEQLVAGGNRAAAVLERAQRDPNRFISAAQLGITVASLLLGWIGEETFAAMLYEPLHTFLPESGAWLTAHGVASFLALALITFLHISLGEQVPKMLALQRSEPVALFTALPTELVARACRPFIAVLYSFTNLVLRALGLDYAAEERAVHSPQELRLMVRRSGLARAEAQIVDRAFAFASVTAGELMVPRTEVVAMPLSASLDEVARTVRRSRHTRLPVYDGSIDNVVGVISATDLVGVPRAGGLRQFMRAPLLVPESAEAAEVAAHMRAERQTLAVVLDEFGGTAGIVTLNDLASRLLGTIGDGSTPITPRFRRLPDGAVLADGLTLLDDVNEELGTRFEAEDVDTLGGLVFARLGRRPEVGDLVAIDDGWCARVEQLDGLRIASVRLEPASVT